MPRIRTIKPEFWVDEKIVELDPWARLLFIGLWNFADDQGFVEYSPKRIKMQIFPGDTTDVAPLLASLLESGLLAAYDSPIGRLLHVQSWSRHQKVSNPATPRVHVDDLVPLNLSGEPTTEVSGAVQSPPLGKERKGKEEGKEGKGKHSPPSPGGEPLWFDDEPPPPPAADATGTQQTTESTKKSAKRKDAPKPDPAADAEFMAAWTDYPRKDDRAGAYASYVKARTRAAPEVIHDGIRRFVAYERARGTEIKYFPHLATWLNRDRWSDPMVADGRPGNVVALHGDRGARPPMRSTTDDRVNGWLELAAAAREAGQ